MVAGVVLCDGGAGRAAEGPDVGVKEQVRGKREFAECFGAELKDVEKRWPSAASYGLQLEWLAGYGDRVVEQSDKIDVAELGKPWNSSGLKSTLGWCVLARGAEKDAACRAAIENGLAHADYYGVFWGCLGYLPVKMQREMLIPTKTLGRTREGGRKIVTLLGITGDAASLEELKKLRVPKDHQLSNAILEAIGTLEAKLALKAEEQLEWERLGAMYWKGKVDQWAFVDVDGGWLAARQLSRAGVKLPASFLNARIGVHDMMALEVAAQQEEEGCLESMRRMADAPEDRTDVMKCLARMKNAKARQMTKELLRKYPKSLGQVEYHIRVNGDRETVAMLNELMKEEGFSDQRERIKKTVKEIEDGIEQRAKMKEKPKGTREFAACFEEGLKEVEKELWSSGYERSLEWLAGHADKVLKESAEINLKALEQWTQDERPDETLYTTRSLFAWCVVARLAEREPACRMMIEESMVSNQHYKGSWRSLAYLPVKMQRDMLIPADIGKKKLEWQWMREELLGFAGDAESLERLRQVRDRWGTSPSWEIRRSIATLEAKLALNAQEQLEWERLGAMYWKAYADIGEYMRGVTRVAASQLNEAGVKFPAAFLNVRIALLDSYAMEIAALQEQEECLENMRRAAEVEDNGVHVVESLLRMKNAKAREITAELLRKHPKWLAEMRYQMDVYGDEQTVAMLNAFLKEERFADQQEWIKKMIGSINGSMRAKAKAMEQ